MSEFMLRAHVVSVGCKLNACEAELIEQSLAAEGYEIVDSGEECTLVVINTCTVTARSDADCRKLIRREKRANPGAKVAVTGCLAQRIPDELAAMPEVDLVVGNVCKADLVHELLNGNPSTDNTPVLLDSVSSEGKFLEVARTSVVSKLQYHGHTRATLHIQEGCNNHCTYCIIPSVRGRSRSRPLDRIVHHARVLVESGYREIALTGVNTASWGADLPDDSRFLDVLQAILADTDVERLRINSLEPEEITDELIDFIADSPRICRHLHVPLQSGSDSILRRMGRRYRYDDYLHIVERMVSLQPDAAVGADIMVGFPGETDEYFEETYRFVERSPLTYGHVFAYSRREGTPAAKMPGQIEKHVKQERSRRLRELLAERRLAFHRRHVGTITDVLVEDSRDPRTGMLRGLTDNYIRVQADHTDDAINTIVAVSLTDASHDGMTGITALSDMNQNTGANE